MKNEEASLQAGKLAKKLDTRIANIPPISTILQQLSFPAGRHGRTRCPIHQGENTQAFSYSDNKGQWYCFRCGFGGDAIELVKRCLDVDFKGALRWFGIEPGKPPEPDPARLQQQQEQLQQWTCLLRHQRELREEFRIRSLIAFCGGERLRQNPDNEMGWALLHEAYRGRSLAAIEYELDELLRTIPREAYPRPEDLPGYGLSKLIAENRRATA